MENLLQIINFEFFVLTGLLILLGLYLEKWQPPIKKQYVALVIFIAGGLMGHFMIKHWAYGILIAGLVYYKNELVEEVKEIKNSFVGIKNTIEEDNTEE